MAVYTTNFFYALDENGNSATGHVDAQIANGAANSTEAMSHRQVPAPIRARIAAVVALAIERDQVA